MNLEFNSTVVSHTIQISIVNDSRLEEDEFFSLFLSLLSSSFPILISPFEASVTIIDDDSKCVYILYTDIRTLYMHTFFIIHAV